MADIEEIDVPFDVQLNDIALRLSSVVKASREIQEMVMDDDLKTAMLDSLFQEVEYMKRVMRVTYDSIVEETKPQK